MLPSLRHSWCLAPLFRLNNIYSQLFSTVRIGCASGFWGDTSVSTPQLVRSGNINYLVYDYLSEITMALLAKVRAKEPETAGFTPDFIAHLAPCLSEIKDRGIRVVSNAGGMNPLACVNALERKIEELGLKDKGIKIAAITGDDLSSQVQKIVTEYNPRDLDSNVPFPKRVISINAYTGAEPIAYALSKGADIVITGRCVDSAIVLGPLMHEFKWSHGDLNKLASGSLAGHILECGAQSTGGIFTDWEVVDGWSEIGFPIAEVEKDGTFIITKPENTGGLINIGTVSEQIVYEIGDPENYILPDVTCDFTQIKLQSVPGGVKVSGVIGKTPPSNYKICATYPNEFRITSVSPLIGPKVRTKGHKTAQAIIDRVRKIIIGLGLGDFTETHVQVLGCEEIYGPHARKSISNESREGVIWIACRHRSKEALEIFSREISPAGTGMAPGQTTLVGGRPRVSPIVKLFSFLYPKISVPLRLHLDQINEEIPINVTNFNDTTSKSELLQTDSFDAARLNSYKGKTLQDLAFVRSGDKGTSANIGVVSRNPQDYSFLLHCLTETKIHKYFEHLSKPNIPFRVTRYQVNGIYAINFILHCILGEGAIANLSPDPQGKGLAQMLSDIVLVE